MKKFYAVIGNPPYQDESDKNNRKPPIYDKFIDESRKVSCKVELITPARFLFNAGQTSKAWNEEILNSHHVKVLNYEQDAEKIFPNTEIKGGVAITYYDDNKEFDPIITFIPFEQLITIHEKVSSKNEPTVSEIVTGAVPYRFTQKAKDENANYVSLMGGSYDLRTNVLDNLKDKLFFENKPSDGGDYVEIFGLEDKKRVSRWIKFEYLSVPENFDGYKILVPKAVGNGDYGEAFSSLVLGAPRVGHTQSFVSLGNYVTKDEAMNLVKYIKTRFARSLLGILKVTQDVNPRVWEKVPLQDFSNKSDIDWSKTISEIDKQLFEKYHLNSDEIAFIESHVKEMT